MITRNVWLLVHVQVTLKQLYMGASRSLQLTRKVLDRDRGTETCKACKGHGIRYQATPMGRIQVQCEFCGGQGQLICQSTVKEKLDVHIPKGAPVGHKINFSEKADEIPDGEAGDVVVVLSEQPHPDFKRRGELPFVPIRAEAYVSWRRAPPVATVCESTGCESRFDRGHVPLYVHLPCTACASPNSHETDVELHVCVSTGDDLYIERGISLTEALCGFQMELTHLDGRTLIIRSAPGDVIRPVAHDPFAEDQPHEWTLFDDTDCPSIEGIAVAGLRHPHYASPT